MILAKPQNLTHAASLWTTGISLLFLGIGLSGAVTPLKPVPVPGDLPVSAEADVEFFDPPPPAAPEAGEETASNPASNPASDLPEVPSLEVPAVIEVTPPLVPAEMEDLIPLKAPVPQAVVRPEPRHVTAVRKSTPSPTSAPSAVPGTSPKGTGTGTSATSGQGSVRSTGNQKGRFPQPTYPSAARRSGLQGTVALTVQVNEAGFPVSVALSRSSGHVLLDSAAQEGVRSRWRWPSGTARSFVVPIRFVLK